MNMMISYQELVRTFLITNELCCKIVKFYVLYKVYRQGIRISIINLRLFFHFFGELSEGNLWESHRTDDANFHLLSSAVLICDIRNILR